jgi:hypothetical protein
MAQFLDNKNRKWVVEVNVAQIRRVRSLIDLDLYKLCSEGLKGLSEVVGDAMRLVDVVFALVHEQAKTAKVTDEDFAEGMAGDAIQQAAEALMQALTDFFPSQNLRVVMSRAREKGKELEQLLAERDLARLDSLDLQQLVKDSTPRTEASSTSSTDSPAPSASTPAP